MNRMWRIGSAASLVLLLAGCTSLPPAQEDTTIQQVIQVDKTAEQLYALSLEWIALTFNSARAVIQVTDRDSGLIIGKGVSSVSYPVEIADTMYTIKLEVRDGRARITVLDPMIKHSTLSAPGYFTPMDIDSWPTYAMDAKGLTVSYARMLNRVDTEW